jgi:hypothetical protein
MQKIAISLHIGVGIVQSLCKALFSIANLSHGGRPHKMTKAMERICVIDMRKRGMDTTINVADHVLELISLLNKIE